MGGVLGGLALLGLLAALIRYYLQRKAQLRIKIGRDAKKVDKKREKERLEAEAAVLEREKFLASAKLNAAPQVTSGDPFAEFGGSSSYPRQSTAMPPPRWI